MDLENHFELSYICHIGRSQVEYNMILYSELNAISQHVGSSRQKFTTEPFYCPVHDSIVWM